MDLGSDPLWLGSGTVRFAALAIRERCCSTPHDIWDLETALLIQNVTTDVNGLTVIHAIPG